VYSLELNADHYKRNNSHLREKFPQNVGTDGDFGRQLQAPLKRSIVFCKQTM